SGQRQHIQTDLSAGEQRWQRAVPDLPCEVNFYENLFMRKLIPQRSRTRRHGCFWHIDLFRLGD
ncbi:MAG: hypothetical protein Q7J38_16885, partial [Gallionella sp.]|nr:hypothetical protein [Gallionella sp.]